MTWCCAIVVVTLGKEAPTKTGTKNAVGGCEPVTLAYYSQIFPTHADIKSALKLAAREDNNDYEKCHSSVQLRVQDISDWTYLAF